jgi:hypothetical protein
MTHAGRSVIVSGSTVAVGLLSLVILRRIRIEARIRGAALANALSRHSRQVTRPARPSSKVPEDP